MARRPAWWFCARNPAVETPIIWMALLPGLIFLSFRVPSFDSLTHSLSLHAASRTGSLEGIYVLMCPFLTAARASWTGRPLCQAMPYADLCRLLDCPSDMTWIGCAVVVPACQFHFLRPNDSPLRLYILTKPSEHRPLRPCSARDMSDVRCQPVSERIRRK